MVEVPSLLFQLDELIPRVDFLSVGSNDLVQFLFAADRGNTARGRPLRSDLAAGAARAACRSSTRRAPAASRSTLCGELASQADRRAGADRHRLPLDVADAVGARRRSRPCCSISTPRRPRRCFDPLVENPPADRHDPREARGLRRRRRAAVVTTLPEAKLDTLLTRHAMVEAELSRQLAAGDIRQAVARIRRDRPGGGQDQGLSRGRGRDSPIWRR